MKGLTVAIECEAYCGNLMLRSLSIQESFKSLNRLLLENHIKTHVKHQLRNRKEADKAVKELMKIFSVSNR